MLFQHERAVWGLAFWQCSVVDVTHVVLHAPPVVRFQSCLLVFDNTCRFFGEGLATTLDDSQTLQMYEELPCLRCS